MNNLWENLSRLTDLSKGFVSSYYPQIILGLSCASCVYLMGKQPKTMTDEPIPRKMKKQCTSEKHLDKVDKEELLIDLKRSQRRFNRKFNNKQFEDSLDLTEEEIPVRSPDYSVVSEVDQRFFADLFHQKKEVKKAYQTDYDSDTQLSFLKQHKHQLKQIVAQEKNTEDRLFFKLYEKVAEQSDEDDL